MELTQDSSLEYGLKVKIAELYLDQNIRHSQVMTATQNVLRDCLRKFDENLTELIQIASMNEKFEKDINYNFKKYKYIVSRNQGRIRYRQYVSNQFWVYLSSALRDNNLIVIKDK